MNTKHLVDPELAPILEFWPAITLSDATLPRIREERAQMVQAAQAARTPAPDIEVSETWFPGASGAPEVRAVVYRPRAAPAPLPAYLHIHGGGYIMGKPEMVAEYCELFARDVGCVIVSVDYRLAPETVAPGSVEDCYAALLWMQANAAGLGIDPGRIAVGGESAGAGLAAALALLARDRKEVTIVFQLLIYPMLDDRTVIQADTNEYTGEFVWTRASNRFGWASLLGVDPGSAGVSPYAAPARAENLEGLPPAFISVGALDLFLDEDIAYASRLTHAGVPVELHVYPGAFHAFELVREARVTKAAMRDRLDALRRALHR